MVVRFALKFFWLLMFSLSLWSPIVRAQKPAAEPTPPKSATTTEPADASESSELDVPPQAKPWQTVKESERPTAPDVYLLPDEFGKLRKVLGFRYEDFFAAWQHDGAATKIAPPSYVLDSWDVSGKVFETHARLRIELAITVQDGNWVSIPIQLPHFILQQVEIEDRAEGECLVFDKQNHGHVVWLSGGSGKKRKLVLNGLAKLKLTPGNHGIELYLPRATTSQFALHVPASYSQFESTPELTLSTVALEDETTEVRLLGQANPLRLNWMPAAEIASNQSSLLEVEGKTTVHLGRRNVSFTTTLEINSFDSPLDHVQIRLPRGARLKVSEAQDEFEIEESDASPSQDQGQVVSLRAKTPLQKPWRIHLAAERSRESVNDSTECVIEGFEVLGAFRQTGSLTLEVDDQLQAYFDTHGAVDQTPLQEPVSTFENRSVLGEFRYTRFPWRLVVFTSPRQRRVSVRPQYDLMINPEEARLDVEYDYQLTGAKIFSLRVNLQGWELTDPPSESGGLIDSNGVVVRHENLLVLPLVDSDAQQIRLNLSLRKDLQLGDNSYDLPEPLGALVVEGELVVDSAEVLRVTPKLDEMRGLSLLASTDESLPIIRRPDLAAGNGARNKMDPIRLRTFLSQPKFVAQVMQRPRQVTAAQHTQIELERQTIRVRQRFDYQSKYRPVSQLQLSLPESLWLNDSMQVTLEGQQLSFGLGSSLGEETLDKSPVTVGNYEGPLRQMVVSLPRPMQNDIPLELTYEISTPDLSADELTPVLLPLASPEDLVSHHEAVVIAPSSLLVTANQRAVSDHWKVLTDGSADEARSVNLRLQTDENLSHLSLYAQLDSVDKAQLATLEQAWIQSWFAPSQRQERAVFRFRTTHAKVFSQLPPAVENSEIEVLLDGKPWEYEFLPENRLAILLPTEGHRRSHTLELRYQQAAVLPSWGELRSSLPRLECRTAGAPIYWQLILPRGWHVTASPQQLFADYWLGWKNYRWGRQPSHSQAHLEQITGAVSAPPPTPLSSQYVYRAFDIPSEIQVVVIRRVWLLLAGALIAFGIGLLWLYTPLARSGLFWLSLALALLIGIFSCPEITLLAIQTILAGGLMTFAAGILRRVFSAGRATPFATANFSREFSTEVTQSWQQKPLDQHGVASETTATLRTKEPLP